MKASWQDPHTDVKVEADIDTAETLAQLMNRLAAESVGSLNGNPAIELWSASGTSLLIGYDENRAVLGYLDSLENNFHSVGDPDNQRTLVIDYYGAHTEIQPDAVIPREVAMAAVERFLNGGPVEGEDLSLEPD